MLFRSGLAAVGIMIVMMLMISNKKVTGSVRLPLLQKVIRWTATAVIGAVVVSMVMTLR